MKSSMRSVFSFKVCIWTSSWVIQTVLNVDMAMVAMEMEMAMNLLGHPGIEISDFCGNTLIMSQKSSRLPSRVKRLTSVIDKFHVLVK
jgi:hypothetical protein